MPRRVIAAVADALCLDESELRALVDQDEEIARVHLNENRARREERR